MTGMAAKLKKAPVPYATHYVGKWDAGMATPFHTPEGRGYDTTLNYFNHKNDFWTQVDDQSKCGGKVYDLWTANKTGSGKSSGAPAKHLQGTLYEEFLFEEQMLKVIANHDVQQPLLLFYAAHVGHFPLQVPEADFNAQEMVKGPGDVTSCKKETGAVWPGNNEKYECRRQYNAMVSVLDRVLGNVTAALKAKGMWDNLLMVFTSDNGGQNKWPSAGGNNFPLRGGKYSPWEGGVRVAAFVSGGFLPPAVRGSRHDGIVHGSDWYTTFCKLAGTDATDEWAKVSGLPPVDGLDVWPMISTNGKSPHEDVALPIDANTLILGDWKLLLGKVNLSEYTGPYYPNATSARSGHQVLSSHIADCSHGCLYRVGVSSASAGEDVIEDTEERNDVSKLYPEKVVAMKKALMTARQSFYVNHEKGHNSAACRHLPKNADCGCWMAKNYYGGFYGPFQEIDPPLPEGTVVV